MLELLWRTLAVSAIVLFGLSGLSAPVLADDPGGENPIPFDCTGDCACGSPDPNNPNDPPPYVRPPCVSCTGNVGCGVCSCKDITRFCVCE
jgi:hypothetical protein